MAVDDNFVGPFTLKSIELKEQRNLLLGRVNFGSGQKLLRKISDKIQVDVPIDKYKLADLQEELNPTATFYYDYVVKEDKYINGSVITLDVTYSETYEESFSEPVIAIDTSVKPK
jgi:hypothetical protein